MPIWASGHQIRRVYNTTNVNFHTVTSSHFSRPQNLSYDPGAAHVGEEQPSSCNMMSEAKKSLKSQRTQPGKWQHLVNITFHLHLPNCFPDKRLSWKNKAVTAARSSRSQDLPHHVLIGPVHTLLLCTHHHTKKGL